MQIRKDLTGQKFNKLTVIEVTPRAIGERTKYKCLCDCGKESIVDGSKLQNNHTKSCGCQRNDVDYGSHARKESGIASRNALLGNYRSNAKYKNIAFFLSDEDMIKLFESDCYYCGREPYMVTKKQRTNGGYIYTGIDRKNNDKSIGYQLDNVVPCCTKCNYIKNKLNHDEFINWVSEVYQNINLKNK
jgi:hypothetical protein